MKIRIYYKDTDMGGIVYHSNYFDFCEMARSELFFKEKKSPVINSCHFAIKEINSQFLKPAFLGDILEIGTKVLKIGYTSIKLHHKITREDEAIFTMNITLVFLCKDLKPHRIDSKTKDFFKQLL